MSDINKQIWEFLKSKGLTDYACAGVEGNLYCESGCRSNNLQNTYEKSLGMSDEEYTRKVDSGEYTNFVHDSAGYGLAQWTYWSRKQNLLQYAHNRDTSIGNLEMQLDFLWQEMPKSLIDAFHLEYTFGYRWRRICHLAEHHLEIPCPTIYDGFGSRCRIGGQWFTDANSIP